MKTDTITLPAYWATALVNGDYSGMTDEAEAARCRAVIAHWADKGWCLYDVARDDDGEAHEARFTWSYRLYDPGADCSGGEVLDYVMIEFEPRKPLLKPGRHDRGWPKRGVTVAEGL